MCIYCKYIYIYIYIDIYICCGLRFSFSTFQALIALISPHDASPLTFPIAASRSYLSEWATDYKEEGAEPAAGQPSAHLPLHPGHQDWTARHDPDGETLSSTPDGKEESRNTYGPAHAGAERDRPSAVHVPAAPRPASSRRADGRAPGAIRAAKRTHRNSVCSESEVSQVTPSSITDSPSISRRPQHDPRHSGAAHARHAADMPVTSTTGGHAPQPVTARHISLEAGDPGDQTARQHHSGPGGSPKATGSERGAKSAKKSTVNVTQAVAQSPHMQAGSMPTAHIPHSAVQGQAPHAVHGPHLQDHADPRPPESLVRATGQWLPALGTPVSVAYMHQAAGMQLMPLQQPSFGRASLASGQQGLQFLHPHPQHWQQYTALTGTPLPWAGPPSAAQWQHAGGLGERVVVTVAQPSLQQTFWTSPYPENLPSTALGAPSLSTSALSGHLGLPVSPMYGAAAPGIALVHQSQPQSPEVYAAAPPPGPHPFPCYPQQGRQHTVVFGAPWPGQQHPQHYHMQLGQPQQAGYLSHPPPAAFYAYPGQLQPPAAAPVAPSNASRVYTQATWPANGVQTLFTPQPMQGPAGSGPSLLWSGNAPAPEPPHPPSPPHGASALSS
jgi:hypothetical protein